MKLCKLCDPRSKLCFCKTKIVGKLLELRKLDQAVDHGPVVHRKPLFQVCWKFDADFGDAVEKEVHVPLLELNIGDDLLLH